MNVIHYDDIRVIKKSVCVEEAGIGRHSDSISASIVRFGRRLVTPDRARKSAHRETVLFFCLLNDLVHKLPRSAEINDPLLVLSPPPLCNQEAHERFPATSWKLESDIRQFERRLRVAPHDLALGRREFCDEASLAKAHPGYLELSASAVPF